MSIPEIRSYISGAWRDGGASADDLNPARPTEVVARVRLADVGSAMESVEAARAAFAGWRALPAPARGEILRKAADLLDQRAESIGREFTREEGKTLTEAIGETRRAVGILRYFAGQTLEPDGDTYPSHSATTLLYARREPVGVVLVITPWNFPMAIPAWKIAPALAYGNTVVWKPAELVPLTSVRLVEALLDAGLPAGVLNLVLGKSATVGDALVTHDGVDAITFTGSNVAGRSIQQRGTERGKKVQLELGGKNPAIVLTDADLSHAAEQVARGAFLSTGQKCTATSRVIVEAPAFQEFAQRLVSIAQAWKLGDPLEPDTRVGPLVSEDRLKAVMGFFDLDRSGGGRLLCGGTRADDLGDGYYVRPTVVTEVDERALVAREEIFGPVAVLLPAKSYADAIRLANDTPFGLSASIFTRSLDKALRFARDIQAGVVKVNQETAGLEFQVPFGGMKDSSSGSREQGKAAREFFTQWKTVYLDPSPGQ
jgi:aldehyde dehydrogenase (NAD+)